VALPVEDERERAALDQIAAGVSRTSKVGRAARALLELERR
jgi:hypothetical protein